MGFDQMGFVGAGRAGASRLESFRYMHQKTLMVMMVSIILVVIVTVVMATIWGLSVVIGLVFLVMAGITLLLSHGKYADFNLWILLALGVIFIMMGLSGITIATVDYSQIGPLMRLHEIFNPGMV